MQYRRPAFTLIELLVVIAIIGILSALVITQLGNSSIKARNATAQSDIAEMGKAVESFRVDDTSLNQVVSNVPGSVDTLNGATGNMSQLFTGTQAVNGSSSTYAASVSKTPSTAYTYRYVASGTPAAATASARQLVGAGAGQPLYALCTNLVNAATPYFCAADGSGAGPSGGDQVLAAQGLGNLSAAATNGLAAWYKLDESGTAAVASDSSGNGNNGSLANFTFDGTTNGWVNGKFGKALLFKGSSDYVNIPASSSFTITSYSFSAWIKTTNAGSGRRRIFTMQPGPYRLMALKNNLLEVGDSDAGILTTKGIPLNDGLWHSVVVTKNAGVEFDWYVDGVNIGTQPTTNSSTFSPGGRIYIATYDMFNEIFTGSIDDLRIYGRALSANEVQQLYQGTL